VVSGAHRRHAALGSAVTAVAKVEATALVVVFVLNYVGLAFDLHTKRSACTSNQLRKDEVPLTILRLPVAKEIKDDEGHTQKTNRTRGMLPTIGNRPLFHKDY